MVDHHHTSPPSPARAVFHASALPLGLGFVVLPVVLSLLARLSPGAYLPLPLVWAVLAAFGALWLLWCHARPRPEAPTRLRRLLRLLEALLVLGLAGAVLGGVHDWAAVQIDILDQERVSLALRWLKMVSPLVYLVFAGLWCWSFGVPSRRAFHLLGQMLALLVLADLALSLAHMHLAFPPQGYWLTTPRETLACLLALGLCAGLDAPTPDQPGWRSMRLSDALIMLALCATGSVTALAAMACVWVFLGRGSTWLRLGCGLVLLAAAGLSVLSRLPLMADTVTLSGHLLWMGGVEHFMTHPEILLEMPTLGPYALSLPSPVAVSLGVSARTELLTPEQVHSLWLRLALVWGAYGSGLILLILTLPAMLRPTRFGSGLVALCITQGTAYGLLHRADVGVVLWLALLAAVAGWKPSPEREEAEPWFAAQAAEKES